MRNKSTGYEMCTVILIFIVGLIMSFAVPTWETPDEYTHLWMIGESIGVEDFSEKIADNIELDQKRIEFHPEEKVHMDDQIESMEMHPSYTRREMMPRSVSLSVIKHLPATIGILLGILLGVPAYWVLQLGEVFSLLFYACICYLALKMIPVKKEMMAFLMLFPMTIQQVSSINYDAVLLPMCCLFIAYILYLKFEKEEIGIRQITFVAVMWLIFTYIKMPYGLLGLIFFIIPVDKIKVDLHFVVIDEKFIKKWRIPVIIVGCAAFLVLIYLLKDNLYIQVVYGFVREWRRGLYLFKATGSYWAEYLMNSTVGTFGWLDTPMAFNVVVMMFIVVLVASLLKNRDDMDYKLRIGDRVVLLGTFIILCLFITMSLANHTIKVTLFGSEQSSATYEIREALYQIPYIGGLQGRYYLPFVPLLFISLPTCIKNNRIVTGVAFALIETGLYIYVCSLIISRCWWA